MSRRRDLNQIKEGQGSSRPSRRNYDDIAGPHDIFAIPIPGLIRFILIPIWILTILLPIYSVYTSQTSLKILYSTLPFVGLGIILYLLIRVECPNAIITSKEGAVIAYRGKKRLMIPWDRMVFVPRKRSLSYGFENVVGIAFRGAKIAFAEAPVKVADEVKKKKEQYEAEKGPSS